LININPKLTLDEAKASLKNISDYALSQNGTVTIETLPSWNTFFKKYVIGAQAVSYHGNPRFTLLKLALTNDLRLLEVSVPSAHA
jgi:hypothetical protein